MSVVGVAGLSKATSVEAFWPITPIMMPSLSAKLYEDVGEWVLPPVSLVMDVVGERLSPPQVSGVCVHVGIVTGRVRLKL